MEITIKSFSPVAIMMTIFTPGLSFQQSKILTFLLSELSERFDGTPISLPGVENLPPAAPRIIFQSSDNQYRLEASLTRLNLHWLKNDSSQNVSLDEFYKFATKTFIGYIHTASAKVGRLASVLTRTTRATNPAVEIASRFCKADYVESTFRGTGSFELHNHKYYRLADRFNVNSWVRWKCGFEGPQEKKQRIIILEQDINTPIEEINSQDFNEDDITIFFNIMKSEFDSILSLYIPKE